MNAVDKVQYFCCVHVKYIYRLSWLNYNFDTYISYIVLVCLRTDLRRRDVTGFVRWNSYI